MKIYLHLSEPYDEQGYNVQDFSLPQRIFHLIENVTAIWKTTRLQETIANQQLKKIN